MVIILYVLRKLSCFLISEHDLGRVFFFFQLTHLDHIVAASFVIKQLYANLRGRVICLGNKCVSSRFHSDWPAWEEGVFDARKDVGDLFVCDVFARVEQNVGCIPQQVLFRLQARALVVVVQVPLLVEMVFHIASVVAECQSAVVVHYSVQVILRFDALAFQEVGGSNKRPDVEVFQREVHICLNFAPDAAHLSEALESDDQNGRRPEYFKLFQVRGQVCALCAPHFVLQNLSEVELLKAVVQTRVVHDIRIVQFLLLD